MDSTKYGDSTVEEAGLEIESEFQVQTNLIDFSSEFKKKFEVLGGDDEEFAESDLKDDRKTRVKTAVGLISTSGSDEMLKASSSEVNNDGYSAINIVFESYFEF